MAVLTASGCSSGMPYIAASRRGLEIKMYCPNCGKQNLESVHI